jgi:lysozyme
MTELHEVQPTPVEAFSPSTAASAPKREPAAQQSISERGLQMVELFEGWSATPYNDSDHNATIGYGHLIHLGPVTAADKKKWGTISKAVGRSLLLSDMAYAMNGIRSLVGKVPVFQYEFDALCSLVFNIGVGNFQSSSALRDLMKRQYSRVPADFLLWDKNSAGQVVPGLLRRRKVEAQLFSQGIYPTSF